MVRLSRVLLVLALFAAALFYLWPLERRDAASVQLNGAVFLPAAAGVSFDREGMLRTSRAPSGLFAALVEGEGLSVEAWLTSDALDQSGPARIVTYSRDLTHRNFTLGQQGDALVLRLRLSRGDLNGTDGQIEVPHVFVPGRREHIVATYDLSSVAIYVDGAPRGVFPRPAPDLGAWDDTEQLALGNELTGDRPWRGSIEAVTLYDRALTADEVRDAFTAGPEAQPTDAVAVAYDFATEAGGVPSAGAADAALERPVAYLRGNFDHLLMLRPRRFSDFAQNFAAFALLGALAVGATRPGGSRIPVLPILAVVLLAILLESLQIYVDGRTSSLFDLLSAIAGAISGGLALSALRSRAGGSPPATP